MGSTSGALLKLKLASGQCPIDIWVHGIRDKGTRARIARGIDKLSRGTGDWKPLRGGVFELRLDIGPGYRVYYGKWMDATVVLISGGDKGTQDGDIAGAVKLWRDFLVAGLCPDDVPAWSDLDL